MICTRGRIGTVCCYGNGELYEIAARAFLHVDIELTHLPFCLLQDDFAKRRRQKTQPTWFGGAVDRGVMKYMSADVLHHALSEGWIESHSRVAIGTHQANMINKAGVWTSAL